MADLLVRGIKGKWRELPREDLCRLVAFVKMTQDSRASELLTPEEYERVRFEAEQLALQGELYMPTEMAVLEFLEKAKQCIIRREPRAE